MLIAHLTESYIASIEVAYKRATSRQNYSEKELQTEVESGRNYARSVLPEWVQAAINSLITFEGHLLTLCEALEEKPIKIGTGQKRMVKRIQPHITYLTHESEKLTIPRKTIMHPQRTYADMLNEVASQLTNLPVFTARVKITSDYGIKEHTIRTLDPKQDTDRPLFKQALVLQSHLKGSSGGQERRLRRKQDLQDACPQTLFEPALIAAGHRRPRSKARGQFPPGGTGPCDPEHGFHDEAMIGGGTARHRLLWGQERTQLLPVLVCERRDPQQAQGRWGNHRHDRGLASSAQPMEVLSSPLVLSSKVRPAQSSGLQFLRLVQRLQ